MSAKRQSPLYFIVQTKDLAWALFALFPLYIFLNKWLHQPFFLMCLMILMVIIALVRFVLGYFNTTYAIVNNDIHVNYGILDVSTINISKNQGIVNYRVTSNWLQKIVGVEGLVINFKNGEDQEPIEFAALSAEQISLLTKHIKVSDAVDEAVENISIYRIQEVNVTWNKIVLTALVSANYFLIIPVLIQGIEFIEPWMKYLPIHIDIKIIGVLLLLVLPVGTIILQFFRYIQFEIYDIQGRFVVKNGLIDSDQHIIEKTNINGIMVEQSLGMRMLGLCTVSAVMNDADTEGGTQTKNTLFPYVKVAQVNGLLEKYVPAYTHTFERIPLHVTLSKIIYTAGLLVVLLVGMLYFGLAIWTYISALILFGLLIGPAITTMKTTRFGLIVRNGLFNLKTYILPENKIGVRVTSSMVNIFKVEHIYTDLTPSHHFKQLN